MNTYSIATVVKSFKKDWSGIFESSGLREICRKTGIQYRKRLLPPVRTIELLLLQMLHGNTAINHLRHLSGLTFTASAYCQARTRLPIKLLEEILQRMSKKARCKDRGRTFIVDGSSFSMPDSPELRDNFTYAFGQKAGCGFPMGHLLALFDAQSQMLIKFVAGTLFTSDLAATTGIHPELKSGDIIVGDRAFCSFAHTAVLLKKGVQAVFRMHQRLKIGKALKVSKKNNKNDCILTWHKPLKPCRWMSEKEHDSLPKTLKVRQIIYKINRPGFRTKQVSLITTIINQSAEELTHLYGIRWRVETNLNHLKTTLKLDVLRTRTASGIKKELLALAIIYNLTCLVLKESANRQGVEQVRLSFVDALRWLRAACYNSTSLILIINPHRPDRFEPRAIKRRPKQYDRLNKPRNSYKKAA